MKIAPQADLSDGLFDVLVIAREPRVKVTDIRLVYGGQHISHPAVTCFRCKRITVSAADGLPLMTEADGEPFGVGTCEIDIHPGKLNVIC